jgi:hypothetical protein
MKLKSSFYIFLFAALIFSCSTAETAIQEVLSGSASSPVFLDCKAVSSTELIFRFSRPVRMVSFYMEPFNDVLSYEEGEEINITLSRPMREGEKIVTDILVEDEKRNTLNVLAPLRARNDRMPDLFINEIRTENSKPKAEFIEFYSNSAGNLGALRVFVASVSVTQPVYEFPPVEVNAGEYIVLHLRSTEEGCVDETGSNLALSGGTDAHPNARDFWVPGNTKHMHKTTAVYLVDQDDRIIDAVLLNENAGSTWGNGTAAITTKMTAATEFIASQGAWLPRGEQMAPGTYTLTPADAASSAGTTNTRTICRDETLGRGKKPENWYVTATSSATPGRRNSEKRHNP